MGPPKITSMLLEKFESGHAVDACPGRNLIQPVDERDDVTLSIEQDLDTRHLLPSIVPKMGHKSMTMKGAQHQ